jgi:alpha-D-xyloside xylohydrolase
LFGWWQSRCSYGSAEEVLGVVREMRDAGFPMDVIHLDTNWFAVDWRCDLEFAPDRFPDPEGLCRELAANGVHLSLWQTPYLVAGTRLHDRLAGVGGFVRGPDGAFLDIGVHFVQGYRGPVHVVDWSSPEAVRVMAEEYGRLFAAGWRTCPPAPGPTGGPGNGSVARGGWRSTTASTPCRCTYGRAP